VRQRHAIGAQNVKLPFNIVPEAARYLADRDIVDIARPSFARCVIHKHTVDDSAGIDSRPRPEHQSSNIDQSERYAPFVASDIDRSA